MSVRGNHSLRRREMTFSKTSPPRQQKSAYGKPSAANPFKSNNQIHKAMKIKVIPYLLLGGLALSLGFTACGGDDEISDIGGGGDQPVVPGDDDKAVEVWATGKTTWREIDGRKLPTYTDGTLTYAVTDQINGYADVEDVYTQYYNVPWGASANNPLDTRIIKDLKIPSAISINGRTYRVISIGVTGEGIDESDNYWSKTHHLVGTVTIPSSVTRIGEGAFANCTGLTSIKVEAGNTTYDSREACNAIIETESNTLIAGCMNTIIPNSVTSIGDYTFIGCTGLTSITIPQSVTSIGSYAFDGCSGLTSIKVETGNTKYDSRDNCQAIIETASNTLIAGCMNSTIPNSVTSIGSWAFAGCTGLTSITIPNSVTSIGDGAFSHCTGLTSITIPNSVTSIGSWAFAGCTGLEDIYALRTDPAAYDCATVAFRDYSATLHVPSGSKEAYASTEPWSKFVNIVEDIDNSSDDAVVLTADGEDVWTDGVLRFSVSSEENGEAVVSGVKDKDNLGAVAIPEKVKIADKVYSVTSIGYGAFTGCTGLTSIDIPNSVTSIDIYAFQSCKSLTSITIPNSVTSIGGDLIFNYCSGLTSIKVDAGGNVLSTDGKTATVAYPSAGKYDARLVLTNLWGSATKELPEYLEISVPEGIDDIYASAPEGALRAYDVQGRPVTQEQMKREPGIYVLQYVQDGRVVRTQKVLRR